jgi:hypothetical protein
MLKGTYVQQQLSSTLFLKSKANVLYLLVIHELLVDDTVSICHPRSVSL